jgi:hypothetical protein
LLLGLSKYFALRNSERQHQSLQYKTPDAVYTSASGRGALTSMQKKKALKNQMACAPTLLQRGLIDKQGQRRPVAHENGDRLN